MHVIGDGPPYDLLREAVDDGGQVDEPLPRVDGGDISDELHPGTVGGEVAFDEVGHVRRSQRIGLRRDPEGPWLAGYEALLAHELTDEFRGTLRLLSGKVRMDSAIPVGAVGLLEVVLDPRHEAFSAR